MFELKPIRLLFLLIVLFDQASVMAASSSAHAHRSSEVLLPRHRTARIPSPDGHWTLIASPFILNRDHTLSLENRTTGQSTLVKLYDRSLGVGWSPDSKAFFLNDASSSDEEDSYIYWPTKAAPFHLDDAILNADSDARRIPADHAYFRVRRWLTARAMLLEYCGHSSGEQARQFDFFYRVSLNSLSGSDLPGVTVHRLSDRIGPLSFSAPECTP